MRLFILLSLRLSAQDPTLTEEKIHGRDAWVLSNGIIRMSALRGGGHLAEIRLVSADARKALNPMRVPHYPTIDPHTFDPARHNAIYSDSPHRWLSSGYMGHLLCFPFYGPPSSNDEIAAGLGNHGEAPITEWKKLGSTATKDSLTFRYGAELLRTQYRVERAITLAKGANYFRVEEWVENLANFDRPFQWMQHATFGPPFVEPGKTFLDVSATNGLTAVRPSDASLASNSPVQWPVGKSSDGKDTNLRPLQTRPNSGTYYVLRTDPSRKHQYFTLYNADYPVLIGYVFPTEGNPWIADWQENKSNKTPPWNSQVVARGIEFGNSPFAEGLRKAVERGSLFGVPSYGWIGARRKLKNEFTVFLMEVSSGFRGVADVSFDGGRPNVRPR